MFLICPFITYFFQLKGFFFEGMALPGTQATYSRQWLNRLNRSATHASDKCLNCCTICRCKRTACLDDGTSCLYHYPNPEQKSLAPSQILEQIPKTAVFDIILCLQKRNGNFSMTFLDLCCSQGTCDGITSVSQTAENQITQTSQKTAKTS